jgi:pyruvate kinase
MRKTKILCTIGPSSESVEVLKDMIREGMTAARLNMAHGDLAEHCARIQAIRRAARDMNVIIPIVMDIKGPEIRIGKLQESGYELRAHDRIVLTTEPIVGDGERVSVSYSEMPSLLREGDQVLLDDGLIDLRVERCEESEIWCRVVNEGRLKQRVSVNLPGIRTTLPGITERDVAHIRFGLEQGIEMIAVSFVRSAADILTVRQLLADNGADHVQIISKIENDEGVRNLEDIVQVSDSIMVARGDLGVEIPQAEVPHVQRQIIDLCGRYGKPVIVATQMLDSMQVNPRPTRAEVSDVANAVWQGADVLMLSGETAAGKYPVEAVAAMSDIAVRTEATLDYGRLFRQRQFRQGELLQRQPGRGRFRQGDFDQEDSRAHSDQAHITEVVCQAAVHASLELAASAIVTPTESGFTPRMVAKYRPKAPIVAISCHDPVLAGLALVWGVHPVKGEPAATSDDLFVSAMRLGRQAGLLETGDLAVITAGLPIGESGTTNIIKVERCE